MSGISLNPVARWRSVVLWAAFLLGLAGLIAMAETDRLIGRSTATGQTVTLGQIEGLGAWGRRSAWEAWTSGSGGAAGLAAGLVRWHVLFDAVFTVGYLILLVALIAGVDAKGQITRWIALGAIAVGEAAEAIALLVIAARLHDSDPRVSGAATVLALASYLKWAGWAVMVVSFAVSPTFWGLVRETFRGYVEALWIQRLSLVVVVVLGVLALVPAKDTLDQIPDAQRRWVDDFTAALPAREAWGDLAIITVVALVAVGALCAIGYYRTKLVRWLWLSDDAGEPREPAWLWWWLPLPAAVLIAGAVLRGSGHGALVDPDMMALFVVLLSSVPFASAVAREAAVRKHAPEPRSRAATWDGAAAGIGGLALMLWALIQSSAGGSPMIWALAAVPVGAAVLAAILVWRPPPIAQEPADLLADDRDDPSLRVKRVDLVGRACVVLYIAVLCLGAVRAFTAPIVAAWVTPDGADDPFGGFPVRYVVPWAASWLCLLVLAGLAAYFVRVRDDAASPAPAGAPRRSGTWVKIVIWCGSIGVLLTFVLAPLGFSGWLGVVATLTLALTALMVFFGMMILLLQSRAAPELFRAAKMQAAPVLTFALVVIAVPSLLGGDPDLHRIQAGAGRWDDRLTVAEAFDVWLAAGEGCARVRAPGERPVRPLVLIAASGGGIRAAVWTATSVATLSGREDRPGHVVRNDCQSSAVFASSGASGGSVGLSVVQSSNQVGRTAPGDYRAGAKALTNPDPLAAGAAGLLVGDVFASTTGLRTNASGRWQDRAALIEQSWTEQVPSLGTTFPWRPPALPPSTGYLMLNSTIVNGPCRALISQLSTSPDGERAADVPAQVCNTDDAELPGSIDFYDRFANCPPELSWATAAMLSARFPFVTPAGRMMRPQPSGKGADPCDHNSWQFIDGGYVDGEGLGTLSDIAPELTALIRDHNGKVAAGTAGPRQGYYVVPIVLYLDDVPESPAPAPARSKPEALVPAYGAGGSKALTTTPAWIRRLDRTFDDACAPSAAATAPSPCTRLRDALRAAAGGSSAVTGSVITLAPPLIPAPEVPLGWTLSTQSYEYLERSSGTALCGRTDPGRAGHVSAGLAPLAAALCPPG
ncbi:hypothetical protein [Gordonia sp. (in: high G+C Gram-positive bacteria)]|uniref:hypothetical protein n=1 Tax=Gordonia sp. (in: high G+C Gram-positive bacteria) TaxID=84139 RepID=UPI003528430C